MKFLIVVSTFLFLAGQAFCAPKLKYISPAGGQCGTEVEVTFFGDYVQDTKEVVFYEPGIKLVKIVERKKNVLKTVLKLEKNCRLGQHMVRLLGKDQFSNASVFSVSQFPSKKEKEDNGSFEAAEEVSMNVTVDGVINNEDIDYFKVSLKKGQTLNAEVEANRLAYGFMDLHLSVFNAEKFLVVDNDDTTLLRQDPYLSYKAEKDGIHYIAIRSSEYNGHGNARYRLHIGSFLRPDGVYPAGGKPGESTEVSFILADGSFHKQMITVPQEEGIHKIYAEKNGIKTPSFIPFQVSKLNPVKETPNNNEKKNIKDVHPYPVVFDGVIEKEGDVDWFAFHAEKNANISVQVHARALRSPLDSLLEVYSSKGRLIKRQDDSPGPDSIINFKATEKGPHYIRIHDHLKGGSPAYIYRISVTNRAQFVNIELPSTTDRREDDQALSIPRGGKKFRVFNINRSGTKGMDQIQFKGLPPGVTAKVVKYSENNSRVPVIFSAAENVPEKTFKVHPEIKSGNNLSGKFKQTIRMNYGQNNRTYYNRNMKELTLGVAEKAPFKVRIEKNNLPLPRYGYHDVKIHIDRAKGFSGDVRIRLAYKPGGISGIDQITVKKDQSSINYRINAAGNAPIGDWPVIFTATSYFAGMKVEESAEDYTLKIMPHFTTAKMTIQSFKQGESGKLEVTLQNVTPFEGQATAKMMGLVNGVTANEVKFDKNSKTISFDVKVDPKTRKGQHKNMFVSLQIPWSGKSLGQNIYTGGVLRVDPPAQNKKPVVAKKTPSKPAAAPQKKLSRLEELRLLKKQGAQK